MSTRAARATLPGWSAASLSHRQDWRLSIAAIPGVHADLARLEQWRCATADPIHDIRRGTPDLPTVKAIGHQVAEHIAGATGFLWLTDVPSMSTELLSVLFLAIGLELGDTSNVYGRLYDVIDHGGSYRDAPIPVSQTRDATGIHTDSSNRAVWPRVVGLACVHPSAQGGASQLVSVHRVHARLARDSPEVLHTLQQPFVRDIVTPGSDRSLQAVRDNAFPILTKEGGVRLRYMRYWIERGHQRIGAPLTASQRHALDTLDALLCSPTLGFTRRLAPGDLLFVNNTTVAHGRTSYRDELGRPRHLMRLWVDPLEPS